MSLAELLRQSLFEKGNFMRVNSALLEKQLFFRGMANRQLELLAENSMPAEFNAGDPILTQGDSASHFHLILEGEVDLISRGLDDETVRIQSIGKGDLLGWSWLFPPYYWHFDARAITPVKTLSFLGTRLRELCDENHDLGYVLMMRVTGIVIKRLQAARRELVEHKKIVSALTTRRTIRVNLADTSPIRR
jgi:CRP/FNR family cyclic AMP-dependent transcriptional regulator